MRMPAATVIAALGLAATIGAQYHIPAGWPSKFSVPHLEVDSSAPGLLKSGVYVLELRTDDGRLVGRLRQGSREFDAIPFSVRGCDGVKTPNWSRQATARGLPPASGQQDRRVELRIMDAETRSCAISGTFTGENDPQPGGRPNPGIPDQNIVAPVRPDLSIRAFRRVPENLQQIQLDILNAGPGPTAATQVKVFVHKDGKVQTTQAPVPVLAGKASVWVVVNMPMTLMAADSVTARVDDPNVVPETDELNNGRKIK